MSTFKIERRALVVGGTVLALALGVGGLAAKKTFAGEPAASVSALDGTAESARSEQGPWSRIANGSNLETSDIVRTGDASRMELKLLDGSVIRLSANSQIALKEVAVEPEKKERKVGMKLFFGKVWSKVSKAVGGDSKFEVETTNAIAGVRGTTFRINSATDGAAVVRVYAGAVAVAPNPLLQVGGGSKKPGERRQVSKPGQIDKKKWEEVVAKAMSEVKVSASGELEFAGAFDGKADAEDEWVAWNNTRDAAMPGGAEKHE